jgi:predicted RNA binding protein YcfA (HicA-like mRNA interferase family)
MSKTFSGKQIVKVLEKYFDFKVVSQKESHVKVVKEIKNKVITTIVPLHKEIAEGTLHGILKLTEIEKKDFLKYAK